MVAPCWLQNVPQSRQSTGYCCCCCCVCSLVCFKTQEITQLFFLNIPQRGPWLKSGSLSLRFPLACVLCLFYHSLLSFNHSLEESIVIDIASSNVFSIFSIASPFILACVGMVVSLSFASFYFLVRLFQKAAANISAGFKSIGECEHRKW